MPVDECEDQVVRTNVALSEDELVDILMQLDGYQRGMFYRYRYTDMIMQAKGYDRLVEARNSLVASRKAREQDQRNQEQAAVIAKLLHLPAGAIYAHSLLEGLREQGWDLCKKKG